MGGRGGVSRSPFSTPTFPFKTEKKKEDEEEEKKKKEEGGGGGGEREGGGVRRLHRGAFYI